MPFRTAISGMRAAMIEMGVIGNNIANASTVGFKKSRTEFADVYPASNVGASSNAAGAGVDVARIAQQFSQGNVNFTDNALDLAINGNGFFVLDDDGAAVYSRNGAFGVDREGYVVNAQGQKLVVFAADASGNITGARAPLQISSADIAPRATSMLTVGINLDASAAVPAAAFNPLDPTSYNNATSTSVYDSLGNSHLATMYYRKTGTNTWETYLYVDGAAVDGPDTLGFSSSGALTTPPGGAITSPSFTPSGGGAPMTLTVDYGTATQFGSPFAVNRLVQDGYTTGRLAGLDVDPTGIILARFTNGQSQVLGQVVLANFANPQGLQQLGDNNWAESYSSGAPLMAAPGTSSLGLLQAGALEESNVDLSEELVKMIIAQRNFQANAQAIHVASEVTQSVINIG